MSSITINNSLQTELHFKKWITRRMEAQHVQSCHHKLYSKYNIGLHSTQGTWVSEFPVWTLYQT